MSDEAKNLRPGMQDEDVEAHYRPSEPDETRPGAKPGVTEDADEVEAHAFKPGEPEDGKAASKPL
jgi:hypothetical protein